MPRVKLTSRNVATLPAPPGGQIDYWDGDAVAGGWFGLRVSARGTRVYTFGYRAGGRVRRMTLGPAGTLSLADARDLAREQLRKLKKVLNHADRDGATAVYDRFTYDGPKRRALEAWGRRLQEIVEGKGQARVVALGRG